MTTNSANGSEAPEGSQTIMINGHTFVAQAPYLEGHTINEAEAATLNQTRAENLRNNFAKKVKDHVEKHGSPLPAEVLASLQSEFSTYDAGYSFHGRRATPAPADPVGREANKIARQMVDAHLRKNGADKKTLPEGHFDKLVEQVLAKYPKVREEAQRRVDATRAVAEEALDLVAG